RSDPHGQRRRQPRSRTCESPRSCRHESAELRLASQIPRRCAFDCPGGRGHPCEDQEKEKEAGSLIRENMLEIAEVRRRLMGGFEPLVCGFETHEYDNSLTILLLQTDGTVVWGPRVLKLNSHRDEAVLRKFIETTCDDLRRDQLIPQRTD